MVLCVCCSDAPTTVWPLLPSTAGCTAPVRAALPLLETERRTAQPRGGMMGSPPPFTSWPWPSRVISSVATATASLSLPLPDWHSVLPVTRFHSLRQSRHDIPSPMAAPQSSLIIGMQDGCLERAQPIAQIACKLPLTACRDTSIHRDLRCLVQYWCGSDLVPAERLHLQPCHDECE